MCAWQWQMMAGSCGHFRWGISGREEGREREEEVGVYGWPAMGDVVVEGGGKLMEEERVPLFRTGLGRSVPISHSSVAKAISLLAADHRQVFRSGSGAIHPDPLPDPHPHPPKFRTAGGRSISVSSDALNRAKALLASSDAASTHPPPTQLPPSTKRRPFANSASSFKKPRVSKFSTPIKTTCFAPVPAQPSSFKARVSMRYPFQSTRMYVREYFGAPPSDNNMLESVSHKFRYISASNADKYKFVGDRCVGVADFFHVLIHSGASDQYASMKWVQNHYKWIVWKLACYERYYLTKSAGNLLTASNVLEELKYRYEREVNYGHRSAIKRIVEGDASPTSMMVLCVSALSSDKVELTDGWYSVDALLDTLLLKQCASGTLFVGQKLRIWGAGLTGWIGPVSPLEVSGTVKLVLHINGTYSAHWADRLGFCKGVGVPLAFRCIKNNGGMIPMTLVGITRIYPILYKERLQDGRSVVRSELMESKVKQSYDQRRSVIVESIVSEFQWDTKHQQSSNMDDDSDGGDIEEGAIILKRLETATEPEILMAELSLDQISSLAKYQAKMEETRQSNMERSIEKALKNGGLEKREVNPFMRVRVVGLTTKTNESKVKFGLVTIWNPTEKQQRMLAEGKAYSVAGLVPANASIQTDYIYLQARESTTWKPLTPQAVEHFEPFFSPRKSQLLSNFGEVPISSEFDIAALIVYVGEIYEADHQKKQWVFVTDCSIYSEVDDCLLLAICFCSSYVDDDHSLMPFNRNLVGSTVCFCNLTKRAKDEMNHLWVAEAPENSVYFSNFDATQCSHLKQAFVSTERWAKVSQLTIDKLREKVLFTVGN